MLISVSVVPVSFNGVIRIRVRVGVSEFGLCVRAVELAVVLLLWWRWCSHIFMGAWVSRADARVPVALTVVELTLTHRLTTRPIDPQSGSCVLRGTGMLACSLCAYLRVFVLCACVSGRRAFSCVCVCMHVCVCMCACVCA